MPESLYDDHDRVAEVVRDALSGDLGRDLATRLAADDSDHPWRDIVRALHCVATRRGRHASEDQQLRTIVADLVDSLQQQGDLDWLASTERPSALLMAHLHRLARAAR